MNHLNKIQNIFPSNTEIPSNMDITEQHEQRLYLLDGELKEWNLYGRPRRGRRAALRRDFARLCVRAAPGAAARDARAQRCDRARQKSPTRSPAGPPTSRRHRASRRSDCSAY